MSLTRLNISPILREMGDAGWDRKMLVQGHPLMANIPRDTDSLTGDYYKVPIEYAKPAGRSHDPATAYANEAGSARKAFQVTPVSDYLIFRIKGQVVRQAKVADNSNSFVDAVKQEVMLALEGAGDNVATEAYRSGTGSRGRVHATTAISATSLTLSNKCDAINFYPGMKVQASDGASADGAALRDSGDTITLASVNLGTGVLVGTGNWSGISGITNNDYLYAQGDAQNGGTAVAAFGLDAWNPSSDPTSTLFCNVDRSVAPSFLGGMRYDGVTAGDSMETVFIQADSFMRIQQGNPFKQSEIYINPLSLGSLRIAKEGSRFIDDNNEYGIGIEKFRSPSGHVLVEDRDCPQGVARPVGKGCFKHCTTGDQPALAETSMVDNVDLTYDHATDTYTGSVVIDHNFASNKPQGLMRVALPSN